ncbi:uncharacterized protein LOC132753808 [Ruditapes philippinarum]|uniref:uncharacterized protein LOC132753808 n=1 Tax=Ruditapes philippinarum TaxID=129788 RepID=UPI00295AF5B8|nr:uncharacterized protein LOC132753808 [Ruditapes philippinarum]
MEPGVRLALLRSKDDTGINEETLVEMYNVYNSLAGVYAPIASVSMLVLGYKWTVHIGSWCLAVSFIILSFVKNVHAIKFLLYGMTGIGSSLVQVGSLIPILEYFTSKRILALMITKVCRYCGQFITLSIVLSGEKTTWQSLYRICMGVSIPIGVIGLTVPTLLSNLKTTSTSFIDRVS